METAAIAPWSVGQPTGRSRRRTGRPNRLVAMEALFIIRPRRGRDRRCRPAGHAAPRVLRANLVPTAVAARGLRRYPRPRPRRKLPAGAGGEAPQQGNRSRAVMTSGYPCPNPACSHVFPPDSVTGAAALKCPRCGTVFRFRPTSARPASAPPAPARSAPEGFPVAFDPAPGIVRLNRHARKRRRPWMRAAVWGALVVVVLILVFRGIPWMRDTVIPWFNQQYAADNPESGQIFPKANCRFIFPGGKWKPDDKVHLFGVAQLLAMRRT